MRPTGEQFVLSRGGAAVTVVEVGGGLRSYRHEGRELLDGYDASEMAEDARGHLLAPWPNRIADGRYAWDGAEHQLALTEPARATAIHGLVRFVPWTVLARGRDSVVLEHLLHPQPGYPFMLRLRVAHELTGEGLRVTTTATNEGDVPLPYGEGHHPYLSAGRGAGSTRARSSRPPRPGSTPTSAACPPAGRPSTARTPTCGTDGRSATSSSTPPSPTCSATPTAARRCASPDRTARARPSGWTRATATCSSTRATGTRGTAAAAWRWSR